MELLAPAGDYDCLRAVFGAGADAAYAGGKVFGARAYAGNFGQEELLCAIRETHVLGKRLYLTVNTLVKNRELYGELYDYIGPLYDAGLDAVLVQDFGVLCFLRKYFPSLPLHASTQMAVTGEYGMRFLSSLGVTRIVAARELSIAELRRMHEASDLEIEAFIHGALCYCYSGRCLMSSMIGGRSGNRGRCAQPCRLPYEVRPCGSGQPEGRSKVKGGTETPLSMKDMNTLAILPELVGAGISSLKIEGRMKSKEYAYGVTEIYRKYLDRCLLEGQDAAAYTVEEEDRKRLIELFSRGGSCEGYYKKYHGRSMIDLHNTKKTGDIQVTCTEHREVINGRAKLAAGQPVKLTLEGGGEKAEAVSDPPQKASSRPVSEQDIRTRLSRLGNTSFSFGSLDIEMEDGLFVPVSQLNDLRREAVDALAGKIAGRYERTDRAEYRHDDTRRKVSGTSEVNLSVSCEDAETAVMMLRERDIVRLYVPLRIAPDVLKARSELISIERITGEISGDVPCSIYVSLPMISRKMPAELPDLLRSCLDNGAEGFLVRDLEMLAVLADEGLLQHTFADASLYAWNDEAVRFLKELGVRGNTVSPELNEGEIRHRDNSDSEMQVYGYVPLMVSAQCLLCNGTMGKDRKHGTVKDCQGTIKGYQDTMNGCTARRDKAALYDRYGNRFPVQCECSPWKTQDTGEGQACYNIIYNSLPIGLADQREKIAACGINSVRLSFTVEEPAEAVRIFRMYRDVFLHDAEPSGKMNITRGHFKRGVL
ncbi:MAG: U32 family peptidase [Blautia sp.]|nr:U32 family peptidase [Blautia sp.]